MFQVAQHFMVGLDEQFVADVGIQVTANFLAGTLPMRDDIHALCPSCVILPMPYDRATPASRSRSSFRPRLRRDMTVPIGMFKIPADSLYENSSTSTSRTTDLKTSGTVARAARISSSVICSGTGGA